LASQVPASLLLRGTVGTMNDDDWYVLPVIEENTTLEIHSSTRHDLRLYDAQSTILDDFPWDAERHSYMLTLDAGAAQPFHLRVAGRGTYEFQLDFGAALEAQPLQDLDVALEVVVPGDQVAAHWYVGQVVSGILRIANSSPESLTLLLDGHSSHHKVTVHFDETEITIPPGTSRELPIRFVIADDLPLGNYPITIRGSTATGGQTTTSVTLSALADAPAVESERVWSIPASMLGGLNAAALSLGAEIVTEDQSLLAEQRDLHDGYTALADGFRADARDLPLTLTVQLAGSDPVPVSGILLNPQSEGQGPQKLRDFELWLSADGQTYSLALADRLSALPIEQAFPLAEPTLARYAQLRLLSNHQGNNGNVELGEWKVVAAPGTPLVNRVNIADPQHGGYVVYNLPQHQQATQVASLLVEDQAGYRFRLPAGAAAEWVLGFQNDRAAQVSEIEWIEAPDTRPDERLSELSVWISEESPVGPWVSAGSWSLTTGTSHFSFPAPAWARYVRLVTPASVQEIPLSAPDAIRIWEQQTDESYRSTIGEWGHYQRSGVYEWVHPVDSFPLEASTDANDSREQAIVLDAGQSAHGQTQIGEDVDWYRVDVPEGQNAVSLHLSAFPTIRVRALFEDSEGNPLPVTVENVSPGEQILTALAPPATSVYFRIEEAPRSIIFAWDTSASVSSYYDTIYSSLAAFIEGVTPGREIVNFLPFGSNLLLEDWGEQPASLQQALNDYNRSHNASIAEGALLTATAALATGEGTKAIIIITDAVSGAYSSTADLWNALNVVHPRIFSLHLSSQISVGEKPANEQDLMQSWASVNAGYYDFLRNQADMETAFERAVVWLRRPADYTFIADVLYVEPPGPGTLQVVSGAASEEGDSRQSELLRDITIEIIVDASGSMMAALDGQRRIDVAKAALLDLADRVLPEGTPVALRVFGNREGNYSCRTDLELPLQPLDRAEIGEIIQEITPQTNASTAIAGSLLRIPDDLAGVPGRKVVILLTDGMETCGGDPGSAILTLLEQGIDIQVNIVGFAITDGALRTQFAEWAQLSGGQYFDAGNTGELSASLEAAVRVPYRVLDSDGSVVAEGSVDSEPVVLPAGTYRVEVLTDPPRIIEDVIITGEEESVLELQE
jgi:hypothetical protein